MKGESKSSRLGAEKIRSPKEGAARMGVCGKDGGLQVTPRYLGCFSAFLLQKLNLKQYFSVILL